MNINDALQRAVSLHKFGKVVEAEQAYRKILRSMPYHVDVNYNLGLLLLQTDRADVALPYLQRAQKSSPAGRQYWSSLVECLLVLNKLVDARAVIERAIKKEGNSTESRQFMVRLAGLESGESPPISVEQEVRGLFNARRFVELEARTMPLLERYPNWTSGWKVLGIALQMQGKDGLAAMQRVVALLPDDAEAHINLGLVLQARGQLDAALVNFARAAQLNPDLAEAHNNQGKVLRALARTDEAIACFRRALIANPNHAEAHGNLGILLQEQGQLDSADASFRRAAELKPDSAEAHNNLGLVLQIQDELDGALTSIRRALQLKPDYAEAHNNLGVVLQKQGEFEAALMSIRRALEIKPDYVYAHINCANVLRRMGRFNEALASTRRALEINPDSAEAHSNLGSTLTDIGQLENSVTSYRRALEINPDYADAHHNLGNTLKNLGLLDDAVTSYRRALELKPDNTDAQSSLLFTLNYSASYSPSYCLDEARQYGRMVDNKVTARFSNWQCAVFPERLRVGIVSGDLRNHPVGYFLESLLAHIDPARIELIAYPTDPNTDALTARIKPYFASWKPLFGLSDAAAARLIHADGVHVLLDLSGHSQYNRLPVFA